MMDVHFGNNSQLAKKNNDKGLKVEEKVFVVAFAP